MWATWIVAAEDLWRLSRALMSRCGSGGSIGHMIDVPDLFAGALVLLTVALFAAMIWAGNHQH